MATKKKPTYEEYRLYDMIGRVRNRVNRWSSEAAELRQRGEDAQAAVLEAACRDINSDLQG